VFSGDDIGAPPDVDPAGDQTVRAVVDLLCYADPEHVTPAQAEFTAAHTEDLTGLRVQPEHPYPPSTRVDVHPPDQTRCTGWVMLPGSTADLLVLRPLGGGDDDIAGVFTRARAGRDRDVRRTRPGRPRRRGEREAAAGRAPAGFRSSGGPFRGLGGLAVTPRSYQLVPLLMALRTETARLLIADAVGVGKTIEACLIVAELLAQGSAERFTVLCSPALAPQWQRELADKFGLDAVLVLPSTAGRLERNLPGGAAQSLFEHHRYTWCLPTSSSQPAAGTNSSAPARNWWWSTRRTPA